MPDNPTSSTTPSLGDKLTQDVTTGVATAAGDAVAALDQWLVTHIHNSPLGQSPALFGLITSAFNALKSLLV